VSFVRWFRGGWDPAGAFLRAALRSQAGRMGTECHGLPTCCTVPSFLQAALRHFTLLSVALQGQDKKQHPETETEDSPSKYQETLLYCEDDHTLAQAAHRGCGICLLRNLQKLTHIHLAIRQNPSDPFPQGCFAASCRLVCIYISMVDPTQMQHPALALVKLHGVGDCPPSNLSRSLCKASLTSGESVALPNLVLYANLV